MGPMLLFAGLSALRTLKKLRFLRLEGLQKVPDIAKSALLLEEAIPGRGCGNINQLYLPLSYLRQG